MADKTLTWIIPEKVRDGTRQGGTFYIEEDYDKLAVRIHARVAPSLGDLEVDIMDDGVSIFNDRASSYATKSIVASEIEFGTHSATAFTVGETINGATSGASGKILTKSSSPGHLTLTLIGTTAFTKGETITGASSGATGTVDAFVRGGNPIVFTSDASKTGVILSEGDNEGEDAEDFNDNTIEVGSWLSCDIGETGGAKDITVSLELERQDV